MMLLEATPEIDPRTRPYGPRGAALALFYNKAPEILLDGPAGTGKAQPLTATVWTPSGPVQMGDLRVGDTVCTPDGGVSTVMQVHPQGMQPVYRVTFNTGESVECTDDHLWRVSWMGGSKKGGKRVRELTGVLTLAEVRASYLLGKRGRAKFWIPMSEPAGFLPTEVPVDPYVLGVLLGDGYLRRGSLTFTSADPEIGVEIGRRLGKRYVVKHTSGYQYQISPNGWGPRRTVAKGGMRHNGYGWMARRGYKYVGTFPDQESGRAALAVSAAADEPDGGIWHAIEQLGLEGTHSWDKFVPDSYKRNSIEVRMDVLRGLMDTDGTVDRKIGTPSFTSVSHRLAKDVQEIVQSLGGACRITERKTSGRLAYNCFIRFNDAPSLFFLARKRLLARKRTKYPVRRFIHSIEPVGDSQCQCITIDSPDSLYLTDGFVVTHNSRAILEKAHLCMLKYAGARVLGVRKTRTSMTESVLVTYETKVLPVGSPIKEGASRPMRQAYHYPNDSEFVIGGMDKADKVMSTEYDMILVFEGTELTEDDLEKLTTRLRNGVMPYQQLLVDCNPAGPKHWLNQRALRGAMTRLLSRHEDNPTVTETYLERLRALTGARRLRLYEGKWAAQEGLVYDEWADANMVDEMPAGWESWRKIRSIDFGYSNPFVCQWFAISPDGAMYLYREIYKTQTLVEDHARRIKALSEGETYEVTVADHDAEDRATLEKHGVPTRAANKAITPGIQAVQARIRPAGNGRRRIFIVRDALVEADPALIEAKKPYSTEQELGEYVWPKDQTGKPQKEVPVDEHNHGMDALRYAVAYVDPLSPVVSQPRRRSVSMYTG